MSVTQALSGLARNCSASLRELGRAGIGFVYPPTCCHCGAAADSVDRFAGLCGGCRDKFSAPIEHPCRRCGAPCGPHLDTSSGCIHCRGERFAFETVLCLGVYDGEFRRACLKAKSPGGGPLAAALGRLLYQRQQASLERHACELVTCVPQHWSQRLYQTQHAADTLARTLARSLRTKFAGPILSKVRRTPAQAGLPASRRRTNLRGAFRARTGMDLSGAAILLVDDVLTTGATSQEATRTLLRAGARSVVVAVLARAIIHQGHPPEKQAVPHAGV